eukprot:m.90210 g.90210  ORF g.90210 m.90210 type:complete len:386 (+) comp16452_c0_seq18:360-1517(+)
MHGVLQHSGRPSFSCPCDLHHFRAPIGSDVTRRRCPVEFFSTLWRWLCCRIARALVKCRAGHDTISSRSGDDDTSIRSLSFMSSTSASDDSLIGLVEPFTLRGRSRTRIFFGVRVFATGFRLRRRLDVSSSKLSSCAVSLTVMGASGSTSTSSSTDGGSSSMTVRCSSSSVCTDVTCADGVPMSAFMDVSSWYLDGASDLEVAAPATSRVASAPAAVTALDAWRSLRAGTSLGRPGLLGMEFVNRAILWGSGWLDTAPIGILISCGPCSSNRVTIACFCHQEGTGIGAPTCAATLSTWAQGTPVYHNPYLHPTQLSLTSLHERYSAEFHSGLSWVQRTITSCFPFASGPSAGGKSTENVSTAPILDSDLGVLSRLCVATELVSLE